MKPSRFLVLVALLALGTMARAQGGLTAAPPKHDTTLKDEATYQKAMRDQLKRDREELFRAEAEGVGVRLDAIARFRGTWSQRLFGIGLVTGLDGTGDSKKILATQKAAINLLRRMGIEVDPGSTDAKNIALVTVDCKVPAFAAPGQPLDVTVATLGDAKSLRNGHLLSTNLKTEGSDEVSAVAMGAISVGGFSAGAGGQSQSKGFVTVGTIPAGAELAIAAPTTTVFEGKLYLDLDSADATTAHRMEILINQKHPEFMAVALGAGTIQMILPTGMTPNAAEAMIAQLEVKANTEAKIVFDERNGTIVIGGNVKIAPCAIARGSLSIKVTEDEFVSQPPPLSSGSTVVGAQKSLTATQESAQIAIVRPNTTVADLAVIFQSLHMKSDDIIAILENMRTQGALKARLEIK